MTCHFVYNIHWSDIFDFTTQNTAHRCLCYWYFKNSFIDSKKLENWFSLVFNRFLRFVIHNEPVCNRFVNEFSLIFYCFLMDVIDVQRTFTSLFYWLLRCFYWVPLDFNRFYDFVTHNEPVCNRFVNEFHWKT